ncbi:hypothetical protein J559_3181 [Acinetobacter sp. 983759]|jgi:hypothetical protein|nr:hypothetical protein J559_3181 [Acinetobacter sp. 983759]
MMMSKYLTSNSVCEMFHITKRTLNRWEAKTPWGIPFPAPAFDSSGGTMKRYLTQDIIEWEEKCQKIEQSKKAI